MKHETSAGNESYPTDKSIDSLPRENNEDATQSSSSQTSPRGRADTARIGWTGLRGPDNRQSAASPQNAVYKPTVTDGGLPQDVEACSDDELATALQGVITAADSALREIEAEIIGEAADRLRDAGDDDQEGEEIRADGSGGITISNPDADVVVPDLTKFQLRILAILADEARYGLAIKRELEEYYGEEVNHGRLYPNLDTLVEKDLVDKSELDRRTNEYEITGHGRVALADELDWVASRAGFGHYDDDGGEF